MVKTNPPDLSSSKHKRKRHEVFIEEKGKESGAEKDAPNIKKGRSTSTSISIVSIDDHTEGHPISIGEYNDSKSGKMVTDVKEKNKKFHDVKETDSDTDSTQVKRKNGKKIVVEIYYETDEESTPVVKKEKIKMVLIEKDLKKKGKLLLDEIDHKLDKASVLYLEDDQLKKIVKKRNNLFFKAYIGGKDYRDSVDGKVDNGKSIAPFDDSYLLNSDSSLLETQSDENDTQSVDMHFDEITVQDEVNKKPMKDHTNNKRKKLDGATTKDYKDVDTHGGNNRSEVDYEKNTDIWVDNGKSIVPFDDSYFLNSNSSLLETQSDENC
ncbi:hypothetical protein Tco_0361289 [Tanacetum coccineum]